MSKIRVSGVMKDGTGITKNYSLSDLVHILRQRKKAGKNRRMTPLFPTIAHCVMDDITQENNDIVRAEIKINEGR
jgi:hypothetical protein